METANKKFRYSIRKFKVGVGSVLIATCLLGAGVSTPTAFAMTDSSQATENTEVKKTPFQHLKELVEELKTDLAELEKLEKYEKSAYPTQDYLWTKFSNFGTKEMERVSSSKEEDSQIPNINVLVDFRNHIKMERLTRQVAQYRIKYPDNQEIENEYKVHLEQRDDANYASQIGGKLADSTNKAEQAFEKIKEIVKKLELKAEEPAPKGDAEAPKDEKEVPAPAPETPMDEQKMEEPKSEMPAPAPKVEEETQEPKTEEKAPETKEETPTPAPEAEAPKAEEEIPTPMPEALAPTPEEPKTEEDAPTPAPAPETPMDQPKMEEPKTDKVESDKQMPEAKQPEMEKPKAEDMPKEEMPKAEQPKAEDSAPKTAVPEVAPKTAEKPKLDFTTKERKVEEALLIKEEIRYDASLALGKSYLLQEGKAGKKVSVYQDVIVDGKVVATNLLSETVVEGQNRILVKGSLEMKKEEVKTTPSVQSNPTLSHKGAPSANKATLPATGEQRNNLALVGLGLAGISLAVVATAINKKSKDQI
ncbi:YSIRK signal domain/LPXTG anchor domain surface protein [Streptococcus suis]|uniref:YSIRK signal domain/LPXTG anchor domain surface protein n=1 Tax=Streptococcus suis TaxID=1307 RepID=UPI0003A7A505|nr:YSIRK signal domain/LPXTG anchor domain surface protein [Streptococcus suis]